MNSLNSTIRSQSEIKESEEMSRYLERRVVDIEKSLKNLSDEFILYGRRTAKLRNNGDKIAEILSEYANNQHFNSSSHACIDEFCRTISIVEDLRNAGLERIKSYVIKPMLDYNVSLKDLKAEIKRDINARKKEMASYKKLDKSRNGNTADEARARANTHLAVIDATKQNDKLMMTMRHFEKAKLEHVPSVLKSFIHIEMLWHLRALERYTEAYRIINGVDCQADLNEFLEDLRTFRFEGHLSRSNSNLTLAGRRTQSLNNLGPSNAASGQLRTSVTFEDRHQRANSFRLDSHPKNSTVVGSTAKPPVANVQRMGVNQVASSDESEYTDDDDYTDDDGTTTASRTASARPNGRPVPQKRAP